MTAYKLLFRNEGGLESLFANGAAQIQYKEGIINEAPEKFKECGYHICAFEDKVAARRYMNKCYMRYISSMELWEIEGKFHPNIPRMCDQISISSGILDGKGGQWPEGTIMLSSVRLVRRLE